VERIDDMPSMLYMTKVVGKREVLNQFEEEYKNHNELKDIVGEKQKSEECCESCGQKLLDKENIQFLLFTLFWYLQDDMLKLSMKFPDLIFEVNYQDSDYNIRGGRVVKDGNEYEQRHGYFEEE